ncbi:MAG: carbohydrate binding family 9 domain-containing protein [Lewinellaceae bacterium]|nr:carbohydrate binding family 9 domain-containing protein [Lewinellaceae bacterium]
MQKYLPLTVLPLLWVAHLSAQSQKTAAAVFLETTPTLDGRLTDSCWQTLSPLDAFSTAFPVFGEAPNRRTEARIFYGPDALYIAAYCQTPDAEARFDGSSRDGQVTGDWFRVSLDTWNDDRMVFDFTVTAAGVQLDSRQGAGNWDSRWQSAVTRHTDGWSVEIRIPFTALRFARKSEQNWGLQLTRYDRSTGETSTWSPQNPLVGDRVLQFGTLTGLRDIRQEWRRSLAVQSEAGLNTRYDPADVQSYSAGWSLDGRVGLSESATLDFTILPQRKYESEAVSVFFPSSNGWSDDGTPEPRQFLEEERDLFSKNPAFTYQPVVYGSQLLWRLPQDSVLLTSAFNQSMLVQATKLSARTQGNWRFGVYNALLGPVQARFLSLPDFEFHTKTVQGLSNYNVATAEYILPNNSYVHLSNSTLLAGRGYTSAAPALNFQVRDRSNAYEVRGGTDWQYNLRNRDESIGYRYNLGLARINRRWGWAVSHQEGYRSIKALPNAAPVGRMAWSNASVQYRDFRPRGVFLNRSGSAGVDLLATDDLAQPNPWYLRGNFSGLDKHFRTWGLSFQTQPYNRTIRYTSGGSYINQRVSPNLGAGFTFISDTRKRLIWSTNFFGSTGAEGEFPTARGAVYATWVLTPRLVATGSATTYRAFKSLTLLPAPGRWILNEAIGGMPPAN